MITISSLAKQILQDWAKPSPYAKPYIEAMLELRSISDNYYCDTGKEIVARFIANAGTWRGPVAKVVKAQLRSLLESTK